VLLSYTLRQWQLWKPHEEQLAGRHPDFIRDRLNLEHQFVVICHQHAYVQLPLVTFTRAVLELEPRGRERLTGKGGFVTESGWPPGLDPIRKRFAHPPLTHRNPDEPSR
jgi:hypothetical protein